MTIKTPEAMREAAAQVAENHAPATQDMVSTHLADACDRIASAIRAIPVPPPDELLRAALNFARMPSLAMWRGESGHEYRRETLPDALPVAPTDDARKLALAREALHAIQIYGSDTLSGRVDGPDDRAWQRESVVEMTNRATAALASLERA